MAATIGRQISFGVVAMREIKGLPEGKTRIRMRQDEFVSLFVRTRTGIRWFFLEEVDDHWIAVCEQQVNLTVLRCPSHSPAPLIAVRRNRLQHLTGCVETSEPTIADG